MRPLLLSLLLGWCYCAAEQLPLHGWGSPPLDYTGFEIVWEAPTNTLPPELWAYRVLPSNFSPGAISNLMALGSFTQADKVPALGPEPVHPRQRCFVSGRRCLGIYPHLGFIEYRDNLAIRSGEGEGVPGREEALRLGTNFLRMLGIDLSQIAPDPLFLSQTQYIFRAYGRITNVYASRVHFGRRVGGVDFLNRTEGLDITFGHHAKVSQLYLSWRNLERHKSYPTANPETIAKWMREGRCVWHFWDPEAQSLNPSVFKKVTIKIVVPYYHGEYRDEPQDWVYPFASLETSVDMVWTNRFLPVAEGTETISRDELAKRIQTVIQRTNHTVFMSCPIIDEKSGRQ